MKIKELKVGDVIIPKFKRNKYTGTIISYDKELDLYEIQWTDKSYNQKWGFKWVQENFQIATKLDKVLL